MGLVFVVYHINFKFWNVASSSGWIRLELGLEIELWLALRASPLYFCAHAILATLL